MLDIGLRNTRNYNAVHRVKPPEPTRAVSSTPTSSKKIWGRLYPKGASKSSYAVSNIGREDHNGMNGGRGSGTVGYSSYYSNPINRTSSLSNQEGYSRQEMAGYGLPRMADTSIETVDLRERGRLSRTSSSTSSSGPSPLHPPLSGGKIPPPHMLRGWRGSGNEGSPKHEDDTIFHEGDVQRDERWRRANGREHAPRDAMLHRSEAFRSLASNKLGLNGDAGRRRNRASEDNLSRNRVHNGDSGSQGPSIPLKHSRHYRKIELQAEKPLFRARDEEEGSSDEEIDSVVSDATGRGNPGMVPMTSFPGKPYHLLRGNHSPQPQLSVSARLELHGRRRNYSGPPVSGRRSGGGYGYSSARNRDRLELGGRGYFGGSGGSGWVGSESGYGNISPLGDDDGTELPRRPNFMNRPRPQVREISTHKFYSLESLQRSLQEEKTNKYCQVTLGERDEDAASEITSSRAGISHAKLNNILSKSSARSLDYDLLLPSPNTSSVCEEEREICLSPPLSPIHDDSGQDVRLPSRGSDSYMFRSSGSMKSPVDEILAPPLTFDDTHTILQSSIVNETISEETEPQTSDSDHTSRGSFRSKPSTDRHSTESYDTGYTSGQGQSPGVNDRRNLTTVMELSPVPNTETAVEAEIQGSNFENESNSGESPQDILSDLSMSSSIQHSQSAHSVRNSQTSYASTDSIRCYVPLVFQKRGKAQKKDSSSLLVVVCLVENSESLIKVSCTVYMEVHGFVFCEAFYTLSLVVLSNSNSMCVCSRPIVLGETQSTP